MSVLFCLLQCRYFRIHITVSIFLHHKPWSNAHGCDHIVQSLLQKVKKKTWVRLYELSLQQKPQIYTWISVNIGCVRFCKPQTLLYVQFSFLCSNSAVLLLWFVLGTIKTWLGLESWIMPRKCPDISWKISDFLLQIVQKSGQIIRLGSWMFHSCKYSFICLKQCSLA